MQVGWSTDGRTTKSDMRMHAGAWDWMAMAGRRARVARDARVGWQAGRVGSGVRVGHARADRRGNGDARERAGLGITSDVGE